MRLAFGRLASLNSALLRNFGALSAAAFAEKTANLAILSVLARLLPVEGFGYMMIAISLGALVSQVSLLGLPAGLLKELAGDRKYENREALEPILCLATFVPVLVILLAISVTEIHQLLSTDARLLVLGILSFISLHPFTFRSVAYIASGAAEKILAYQTIKAGSLLIAVYIFVAETRSPESRFLAEIFVVLLLSLPFCLYYGKLLKDLRFRNLIELTTALIRIVSTGAKMLPIQLLLIIMASIDKWMLAAYVDSAAVAIYSAIMISQAPMFIVSSIVNAVTPQVILDWPNADRRKGVSLLLKRILLWGTLMAIAYTLLLVFFSDIIITITVGDKYSEAAEYLYFGGIMLFLNFAFLISVRPIFPLNKEFVQLIFVIMSLLINVGLNYVLIPKYEYVGALYATTAAYCALALLAGVFFIRESAK